MTGVQTCALPISKAPNKKAKVEKLKELDNPVLRGVLSINFDPNIVLDLPEGDPPYKGSDPDIPYGPDINDSNLYAEFKRMYLMVKNHPSRPPTLRRMQVENIWIQILEACHHTESKMLCQMKSRELSKVYKGLTYDVVAEAFPGLLPETTKKADIS